MKNQEPKDIVCKKIAWTIKDFSELKTKAVYSEAFAIDDRAWKVLVYPNGDMVDDHLSLYLGVADAASLPRGWSINAECSLALVNQVSREGSVKKELKNKFCATEVYWGFRYFLPLSTFRNLDSGYILNDNCIIEVEFFDVRSEGNEPTTHPTNLSVSKESKEVPTNLSIDFMELQIDKSFVPLLEEVCLWHPSLVQWQKKRSHRFTEWAFTALARVLQFVKTKKWKDMNEDACDHLQQLWEELETCKFDLTWLEPHVQSALGMKGYMEKAKQVKKSKENLVILKPEMMKLKENLVVLETEMKKLTEKLANAEESAENMRKDLIRVEESFEERDLDAEIGYEKP